MRLRNSFAKQLLTTDSQMSDDELKELEPQSHDPDTEQQGELPHFPFD
jgi:hypothetical protein